MAGRQLHRHVAAQGQAHDDRPAVAGRVDDPRDLLNGPFEAERARGQRPVAGQVEGHHPVPVGQAHLLRPPHRATQASGVDEHDRAGVGRSDDLVGVDRGPIEDARRRPVLGRELMRSRQGGGAVAGRCNAPGRR